MHHEITVREYAKLTTGEIAPTLLQARISQSAFEWLCRRNQSVDSREAPFAQVQNLQSLRLDNYVGVIETPCGTRVEILPKNLDAGDNIDRARRLLVEMLARYLDLPSREVGPAGLHTFKGPLTEWLIARFLLELDRLVKRGLRFTYHRVEEEHRFLRGRLDLAKKMQRPPGRQNLFDLQHDIFDPDRAENRLLRLALDRVCRVTQSPGHWRIARELDSYLSPIPPSQNIREDFRCWQHDRLMASYNGVRPLCQLILNEQIPTTVVGKWHGISFLFPMEKVFERYVADSLKRSLGNSAKVITQAATAHLCRHQKSDWFELRPDLVIVRGARSWILDTKWKRLDQSLSGTKEKYEIGQDDMYQMFAYGHRYLNGRGAMLMIYPKTKTFPKSLGPFEFSKELKLWAAPFDLEASKVVEEGLPADLKTVVGLVPWADTVN